MNTFGTAIWASSQPHSTASTISPPSATDNPDLTLDLQNYKHFRQHVTRGNARSQRRGMASHPNGIQHHRSGLVRHLNPILTRRVSEEQWENMELLYDLRDMWARDENDFDMHNRNIYNVAGFSPIERLPVRRFGPHTRGTVPNN